MTKLKVKEKDILRTILNYLAATGEFFWRNNSGAVVSEYNGKSRFMRFGDKGSPDIFIIKPVFEKHINTNARESFCTSECMFGQIYGCEVKAEKGAQSDNQKEWQANFEKAGGKYLLVRSLEEFIKLYER